MSVDSYELVAALGASRQLRIARAVRIRHPSIRILLPFFLLFALIGGIVNGLATDFLLVSLYKHPDLAGQIVPSPEQ